jgi:hydroxymethylglutaryl-CoA lyase
MISSLKIYEVGPRDGLQNEAVAVSTGNKVALIAGLVSAGLTTIEATSFVNPKAVPQMADANDVMSAALDNHHNSRVRFVGLVFNRQGYDRALASGCRSISFGVSVSDTFSRRNTGMSSRKLMHTVGSLVEIAKRDRLWTRVYISAAWVCPFEGPVAPNKAVAYAEQVGQMEPDEISIADTVGYAEPLEVGALFEQLARRLGSERLAAHLHDTQALGLAHASAAIQAGVRIFDTSIGGIGGCPFAPGAAGNLATEDLVFMAYKMGLGTGVDFDKLWSIIYDLEQWVGRPIGGRIRPWWESMSKIDPTITFK